MDTIASLTPIILFGGLVVAAIVMGGSAMDEAANNRK
jgi:hypothetical protein